MVEVRWTKLALDDLNKNYVYISNDLVKYAQIQILRVKDKNKILHEYPLIGKPLAEFPNSQYRQLIHSKYIIYKIVSNNQIDILTIHHFLHLLLSTIEFD